jgi:hypothetical protein
VVVLLAGLAGAAMVNWPGPLLLAVSALYLARVLVGWAYHLRREGN